MNQPESNKQLAEIDLLLDQLAQLATDPGTTATSFFGEVRKVVDAIIAPDGLAVVAIGPRESLVLISGDASLANDVVGSPAAASNRDLSHPSPFQLKPKTSNVEISEIGLPSGNWGWLITRMPDKKVSPVHRDILAGIAQIVGDYLKTRQLIRQAAETDRLQQFSANVHSSLKLPEVANHIANDARLMLNCERVSVYSIERERARLLAISSVAMVERRSELIKSQSKLVRLAGKLDEPVGSDRPPGHSVVSTAMKRYQQQSGFPFLFGVGLVDGNRNTGYLLAESDNELDRVEFARGLTLLIPPASRAISNAKRYESVPAVLRAVGGTASGFGLSRAAVVLAALFLFAMILIFVKADYAVRIEGELRPLAERVAFAPHDGLVEKVFVSHGEPVKIGQPLLQLRSRDMELALTRNSGEFDKLTKLLDSKNIALNQASSDPNVAPSLIGQLTSEISDIEFQLKSLEEDQTFLETEQQELTVVSPIEGNVITWKVDELLIGKPVRWGDPLVTIANEDGQWDLRFKVPERRIGYLLTARQEGTGTELEFFFESKPVARFQTTIASIGSSTEMDPEIGPFTEVIAPAPEGDYVRRHGAKLIADVDCGRKSIAYIWTKELVDSLRRRFVW